MCHKNQGVFFFLQTVNEKMARTFKVKICRSVSIQIAMINFHNVLLYIFARAQNIHESKKEFHRKLQKACQIAFERTPSYMHKSIARSILIALHISIYLPLASFQEELKRAENDVITYICCFFNTKNIGYIQTVSSDFNRNWYQSKSNILQEFILKQMKCEFIFTQIVFTSFVNITTITLYSIKKNAS